MPSTSAAPASGAVLALLLLGAPARSRPRSAWSTRLGWTAPARRRQHAPELRLQAAQGARQGPDRHPRRRVRPRARRRRTRSGPVRAADDRRTAARAGRRVRPAARRPRALAGPAARRRRSTTALAQDRGRPPGGAAPARARAPRSRPTSRSAVHAEVAAEARGTLARCSTRSASGRRPSTCWSPCTAAGRQGGGAGGLPGAARAGRSSARARARARSTSCRGLRTRDPAPGPRSLDGGKTAGPIAGRTGRAVDPGRRRLGRCRSSTACCLDR